MKNISLIIFTSIFSMAFIHAQSIDYNVKCRYIANGYDVVSYFDHSPKKGKRRFVYQYNNVKLKFASQANLDLFKANPGQYIPQYGGWCAYAMAKNGKKVKINPKTYEIRDGKLYLFYNSWGTNTLELWLEGNPIELLEKADENWERVKFKK